MGASAEVSGAGSRGARAPRAAGPPCDLTLVAADQSAALGARAPSGARALTRTIPADAKREVVREALIDVRGAVGTDSETTHRAHAVESARRARGELGEHD